MTKRRYSLFSLPVVACLLAVLTLGLILLGRYYGLGAMAFVLLVIPIALAVAYLAWYRTLPYDRPAAAAPPPPQDGEPFEDPVEEADRIDNELDGAEPEEPPGDVSEIETPPS